MITPGALRVAAIAAAATGALCAALGASLIVFSPRAVSNSQAQQALRRDQHASVNPSASAQAPGSTSADPGTTPGTSPGSSRAVPGDTPGGGGGGAAAPGQSPAPPPAPPAPTYLAATQPGVYGWTTSGYEVASGFRRDLPGQSQEVISRTGGSSISVHHIFSDQKESWLNLVQGSQAVVQPYFRSRVFFGPFGQDKTINFSPAVTVFLLPPEVGQSWSGSFSGSTYGSYTGRTIDHSTMNVGGEGVEVWGVRLDMQIHGDIDGTSSHQTWFSPKYGVGVRDVFNEDFKSGNDTYHCEGSMTSNSIHPQ